MGNIETTMGANSDIITIDISGISSEQRRLLKKCIDWENTYEPDGIPLVAALLLNSMVARKEQMSRIIDLEAMAATASTKTTVIETL